MVWQVAKNLVKSLVFSVAAISFVVPTQAQVILNEANAVSETEATRFLSSDPGKPYEGYDYGAFPYSGNTNLPNDPVAPGNPFAPDISSASGVQTSFVDGFDIVSNPRGFARIKFNGGNWIELAVTNDHADLRGYTFYWQDDFDDDGVYGELKSQDPTLLENERGAVTFSDNKAWADLRAGTILTISERMFADEVRDDYPYGFAGTGQNDTGYDYDLSTDLSFSPFDGNDDWHVHFHLDETATLGATPADTPYFLANSDLEVSNEQWAGKIMDPTSTIIDSVRNPALSLGDLDVNTGDITGFIGENDSLVVNDFGAQTGGAGVGDDESITLLSDPDSGETGAAYYEDTDWSTFGLPNLFNRRTDVGDADGDGIIDGDIVAGALNDETTLSQVQNFSRLRDTIRANSYDWNAAGTNDFASAANWQRANDNAVPAMGPDAPWTASLANNAGGARVAQVTSNATVAFATVMATSGSMRLEVQSGATLSVVGDTTPGFESPGRVLVMGGGILQADGVVDASAVEGFSGALVAGTGSLTGELLNSGGTVRPGGGSGGTLSVGGDYVQDTDGTLAIDIAGAGLGQYSVLSVAGTATLDGLLEISLGGFTPANNSNFTVLTSAGLTDLGLSLSGDSSGFSLSIVGGTDLVLSFMGSAVGPDFSGDGMLDCADINLLTGAIADMMNDAAFDLTGDGFVDLADRDEWLTLAGAANLASGNAYLLGDANLDGDVDGQDFIDWNSNKFRSVAEWCAGDFNADGIVDGQDFIQWNSNKFMSADAVAAAVPEPMSAIGLLSAMLCMAGIRRRRTR